MSEERHDNLCEETVTSYLEWKAQWQSKGRTLEDAVAFVHEHSPQNAAWFETFIEEMEKILRSFLPQAHNQIIKSEMTDIKY